MPPTGLVSFPGVRGLTQWSMTLSHGITPSVCLISAVPQGVNPKAIGPLTFTYDRTRFTLYDCLVDSANLSRDQSGNIVSLVILDKRWRWKFGSITGHYNRRKKSGSLDLETEKTPQELARLLFAEMKESRFDVSMMPNDQRPECDWDYAVPAQELADLCDDLGCRIVLCLDNVVRIIPIGTGNPLPNSSTQVNADFGYDPPFHPDSITLVGAETRYQTKFKLERVGEEFDGSIKKIDDLSYKPSVGWGQAGFLGRIVNINETGLTFVQKETARALANKTVNKWYRICATGNDPIGTWNIPGRQFKVNIREQVLPLESGLVQTYIDSDGVERPRNAMVTGKYWNTSPDAKNLAGEQRVSIPFSIDEERGIVILSEALYKLSNGEVSAPELWVTVGHGISSLITRQKDRYTRFNELRKKPLGTGTLVIHREELQERIIGAIVNPGSKTAVPQNSTRPDKNTVEVEKQADYWLKAAQLEFQIEQTADLTYAGLLPISPDGAIQQVSWQSGPQGCYTRASRNSEHSRIVPSYKERRIADRAKTARENARKIVKKAGRLFRKKGNYTMDLRDMQWEEFRNDSGEEVPAFAVMRCTGIAIIDVGRVVLKMDKPNTYGSQYLHYINGPIKVASGNYGLCTQSTGAPALYDTADGTPAFGERWGPRDSTWKLKKYTGGWAVIGNADSTNGIVIVRQAPMLTFHGITDAAINKDAAGTVSIHYRSGATAYTDTGVNMTGVLNSFGNIGSGKDVRCVWEDDATSSGVGWWEFEDAEC